MFDSFRRSWYIHGMIRCAVFIVLFLLMPPAHSYGDIYKYVDKEGVIHFTNISRGADYEKIIDEPDARPDTNLREIARRKAEFYGVNASIIEAIIEAESGWDPNAVSEKGAMGLMQIMPETAVELGLSNPFDPEENIDAGIQYFKSLLDRFAGDTKLAVAAYNAGPSTVESHNGVPSYDETRRFIKNVLGDGNPHQDRPARIYKVVYKDGTVLYTNIPQPASSH